MYARTEPFQVTDKELVEYVVDENFRPQMPETIPKELAELVRSCWQTDSQQRPDITYIEKIISKN